jgi:hemolysin activation/secretion protein
LGKDSLFLLRSDLQLAADELLALEQFSAGGQQSVRGYRQDALLADSGFFLSAEVRLPILRISKWDSVLQLTPFVDFATLWNNGDSDLEDNSLASVGLGLRFNVGDKFNARLDWGIPLTDINDNEDKDTLQENGIYFQVEYRPF